jgi:hypothetical protein
MFSMLSAIEFNNKPTFWTTEINNKGDDEMLATEFHATQLSIAQVLPKLLLCFCLILSKTPRPISQQK